MNKIYAEGHRGFCAKYPENTLPSFAAALKLGVDVFEFDIHLSKDKIPVIMHDGNAKRTCGVDRRLCDMTLAEIKELDASGRFSGTFKNIRVPTFEEVLTLVKSYNPKFRLGIEIKSYTEETVDLTMELLNKHGFSLAQCWFYCFNAPILKYLKLKYNAVTMGYPDFQMSGFEEDSYSYYDEIGISMGVMTPELCKKYSDMGLPMHMYCADTVETVKKSIENGASLITANDPVPLMTYLNRL